MPEKTIQIDSTIDIVTPENISFNYRVAGPFRRLLAYAIDFGVRAIVMILFVILGGLIAGMIPALAATMFFFAAGTILFFLLSWFYGGLFETFWNGQTPGKWLLGIRVLSVDGRPINGLQAVMRNILRGVELFPMLPLSMLSVVFNEPLPPAFVIPTFGAGLIAMGLSRRYQRIGDLVCRTVVVFEERSWLMGVARLEDPRAAQLASFLPPNYEVSRGLARALAIYVERRRFFSLPRRREIARHLGAPLIIEFGLPADTSHDLLLCALYYRTFIAAAGDDARLAENPFAAQPPFAESEGTRYVLPPLPQKLMVGVASEGPSAGQNT